MDKKQHDAMMKECVAKELKKGKSKKDCIAVCKKAMDKKMEMMKK